MAGASVIHANKQARNALAEAVYGLPPPDGWEQWSVSERACYLLRLTQDFFLAALSWRPIENLDPHQLATAREAARGVSITHRQFALADHSERARRDALDRIGEMVGLTQASARALDVTPDGTAAPQQSDVPDAAERRKNGDKTG